MKSKKKLLLLGVGAMGALALGVGATSTFAWFQTQQTANAVVGNHSGVNNITVDGPSEEAASYNFTIAASIATSDVGSLILSTVEGDPGALLLKSYTLDAGLQKVPYTPVSGDLLYVHYVATITGTFAGNQTDEAEVAMLNANNKTYTLTVGIGGTSSARGRIGKTSKTANTDAEGTAVTGTSDLSWTLNVSDFDSYAHTAASHVYTTTVDFYFRAEGENTSGNPAANVADDALSFAITASGAVSA